MQKNLARATNNSGLAAVALLAVATAPGTAVAQENVMVVFDASGSMYQKINGKTKLEIAKESIISAADKWYAQGTNLGFVAYGHRRKRDCSDIEVLVKPGPIRRDAFRETVNGIAARGSTPLTQAVETAARAMDYTNKKATVILMSDGRETCEKDPCQIARRLERAGVEFTAHVIALNVKAEDEAGLRCLATETGGRYISAANASHLTNAFFKVSAGRGYRFAAVSRGSQKPIEGKIHWRLSNADIDIERTTHQHELNLDSVEPGRYRLYARSERAVAKRVIDLQRNDNVRKFDVLFDENRLTDVSIDGPTEVVAGQGFSVRWSGPNRKGDKLQLARRGVVPGLSYLQSFEIQAYDADQRRSLPFLAPATVGEYELRYFSGTDRSLLARERVTVLRRSRELRNIKTGSQRGAFVIGDLLSGRQELHAVRSTERSLPFEVHWTGRSQAGDWISIAKPQDAANEFHHRSNVEYGNSANLRAPGKSGRYEIRYVNGDDSAIVARKIIEVR